MRTRRLLPIPLALAVALAFGAGTVSADCELAGPLDDVLPAAPIAFVGTVVEVAAPVAFFEVREVWAGEVGHTVEVHGLTSGVQFSEDDRQWEAGATYLVLPYSDGGVLRDSICTATTEWTDDLAALRPADATHPCTRRTGPRVGAHGAPGSSPWSSQLVAGISWVAFRRSGEAGR